MLKKESSQIEELLKGHPKKDKLIQFLQNFYCNHSAQFKILFGSSATGDFNYRSDIDLLIVSDSIKGNHFERLKKMYDISNGGIDFFVYSSAAFEKMVTTFHITALEALSDGILLYDKGLGQQYKAYINRLIEKNKLQKSRYSWTINV